MNEGGETAARVFRTLCRGVGDAAAWVARVLFLLYKYPALVLAAALLLTTLLARRLAAAQNGTSFFGISTLPGFGWVSDRMDALAGEHDMAFFWAYVQASFLVMPLLLLGLKSPHISDKWLVAKACCALLASCLGLLCLGFVNSNVCSVMDTAAARAKAEAKGEGARSKKDADEAANRRTYLLAGAGALFAMLTYAAAVTKAA
jgi:hypothetical protein